jgi:hypothetical protein
MKVDQNFGLLLYFSKKRPKENNRLIDENSLSHPAYETHTRVARVDMEVGEDTVDARARKAKKIKN